MLSGKVESMKHILWAGIIVATTLACGAPRAAPLGGDIGSVLERGIESGSEQFDHSEWDELLSKNVRNEGRRFDYVGLKAEEDKFNAYLQAIASAELSQLASREIQALFANAYNAYTIKTVLDHVSADGEFSIDSIRDVPDVFERKDHTVGGFALSLDNMEHNVLRPMFKDPRFHFAVNCASVSCPPVPMRAFTGERLDDQLDELTRAALTNPDYVSIDGEALLVTKIMEWYGADFIDPENSGSASTLAAYIAKYATEDVRAFIAEHGDNPPVTFRDYDWHLNKP